MFDRSRLVVAALVAATISTVFPGFAAGALSVQLGEEFGVGESAYGWALSSFFLAAAAGSVVLGRTSQRFGARRQILVVLAAAALVEIGLATLADSFAHFLVGMVMLGFINSGNQTAINLAISEARLPRMGLAISIKQSGMPAAAMLSGLAVPALALTIGWRWVYVVGAVATLAAFMFVAWLVHDVTQTDAQRTGALSTPRPALFTVAVAIGFLAFCAGVQTAWVVGSGVDTGLGEGTAGLMLSLAAGLGILVRLAWGFRLDWISWPPLWGAGAMMLVGTLGYALLVFRSPGIHIAGTMLAFGGGWIWPVFTNYAIVKANPDAAGRATGITQMGVYVGVFTGPLVGGWVIDAFGYSWMWAMVMAVALVGAGLIVRVAPQFAGER